MKPTLDNKVAQPFCPVKSTPNLSAGNNSHSMIHHKVGGKPYLLVYKNSNIYREEPYGVSSSYRVLTPGVFRKKFDQVRDFLYLTLGLTGCQVEVVLRLLRFWAYYGNVYPKEAQVSLEPGCSKATFWRTIRILEERGLVLVLNRFLLRQKAQISNLYRLDRLVLALARYIAEHGHYFYESWLQPYLTMPAREFWDLIFQGQGDRAGPLIPAF